jgi:hypothetical protein
MAPATPIRIVERVNREPAAPKLAEGVTTVVVTGNPKPQVIP